MKKNGFTLIELIVVIGILTLLSTSLITYSRTGEKQIIFFKEQGLVTSAIFRAKNLAISTYGREESATSCGYGVYFSDSGQEVIIFSDLLGNASNCNNTDKKYSGANENIEKLILDSRVRITNPLGGYILFIPPEPTVFPARDVSIRLELDDESKSATINVNRGGQITTQ